MEQLHPRDPQHIGPYHLLARLGAGGMGQVYLARRDPGGASPTASPAAHPAAGATTGAAAVKLIHPHLAADPGFRTRFRREVAAARLVGGARTAPVLDADPDADIPWLATAYIAGPSLRQAVARDFGPLPAGSVRALAEGLAYALQDIHRAGLVHRDLKPGNILLTLDGPRVIDFGIARALETTDGPALTQTGELLGSPGFLAPEQIHGAALTPACDVFGLGAVLAYAATGRLPFGDPEQPGGIAALLLRITEAEPDLAGVPPELRDLVRDCLRKEPAARPSPAEVLARVAAERAPVPDPWLPAPLLARLGLHAVALLDREDAGPDRAAPTPPRAGEPEPSAATATRWPSAGTPSPSSSRSSSPSGSAVPSASSASASASASASSVFLVSIALVVAVAAGGTVYAFMTGDDQPLSAPGAPPATGATASSPASIPPPAVLPAAYAGTWRATSGGQSWRLTLTPGGAGTPVMSLTVQAPGIACAWSAPLDSAAGAPAGAGTVGLAPSTVTSGAAPTCTPGGRSTLRLLPDGSLVRELADSPSAPLTYHRQ
ncbi:protein kinase domain-containing protein [Streptomyces sp. NBC_00096]|uniref:protein kinase domain-containing protein n=1 Tax=Streptomyces sp. NBC_00096 TaxID=2975650 RepID=UPI0032434310